MIYKSMTQEEFIGVLEEKGYSYEIKGDKILVTHRGGVDLNSLQTLPPGVEFKNKGYVWLMDLKTLPPGVEFKNKGWVNLRSLQTLPPGVQFKNSGLVNLRSLQTLPPDFHFKNGGDVILTSLGLGWVEDNKGIRIEGVDNKRLLNLMIKKELFI